MLRWCVYTAVLVGVETDGPFQHVWFYSQFEKRLWGPRNYLKSYLLSALKCLYASGNSATETLQPFLGHWSVSPVWLTNRSKDQKVQWNIRALHSFVSSSTCLNLQIFSAFRYMFGLDKCRSHIVKNIFSEEKYQNSKSHSYSRHRNRLKDSWIQDYSWSAVVSLSAMDSQLPLFKPSFVFTLALLALSWIKSITSEHFNFSMINDNFE